MNTPVPLWLVYALLAALFAALVSITGKIGVRDLDPTASTAIRAIVMTLILVPIAFALGRGDTIAQLVRSPGAAWTIALSGLFGALSWLAYFAALKLGPVTKIAPIDRLSVVIAVVLAAIVLGERITLKTGIGAALIVAGAVVLAISS